MVEEVRRYGDAGIGIRGAASLAALNTLARSVFRHSPDFRFVPKSSSLKVE